MVLADIGEVGVYTEGGGSGRLLFILRPSLYAMSRLGAPDEIVALYAFVMSDVISTAHAAEQFRMALSVLYACAPDDAPVAEVFGYFEREVPADEPGLDSFTWPPRQKGEQYVMGSASVRHVLPLARCLLKHGVTGALPALPPRPGEEPEYVQEFDAREHVALAMAHLSIPEADAWRMTMTSLSGALRAKFPPQESDAPGARAPSKAEHDATMERFDKIDAKRKAKAGL